MGADRTPQLLRTLTYQGRSHTINEWAEITGLSAALIRQRADNGWTAERTLTEKPHPRGKYLPFGDVRKLSAQTGIPTETLRMRLHHGWSIADALTTPVRRYQPRSKPGVAIDFGGVSPTEPRPNAQDFSQLEISE